MLRSSDIKNKIFGLSAAHEVTPEMVPAMRVRANKNRMNLVLVIFSFFMVLDEFEFQCFCEERLFPAESDFGCDAKILTVLQQNRVAESGGIQKHNSPHFKRKRLTFCVMIKKMRSKRDLQQVIEKETGTIKPLSWQDQKTTPVSLCLHKPLKLQVATPLGNKPVSIDRKVDP